MDSDDEKLKQQILTAKWVTQRTGQIAEIQTRQLQLWGLISFVNAGVDDVKIFFDWPSRSITYDLSVGIGKSKKLPEINARLNKWVQDLLGEEYRIIVKSKGKVAFEGDRQAEIDVSR